MQWLRKSAALVAVVTVLAMMPSGSFVLAACWDTAPESCCCSDDCPDRTVRASRTMPCCKPGPAPVPLQDTPVQRIAGAVVATVAVDGPIATAVPDGVRAPVDLTVSGVRPVPLFRLHESLLI